MERILELLNEKNHYLEKFYSINENEINNFYVRNFNNIETFYKNRESILEIIKYIDAEVDKENLQTESASVSADFKSQLKLALATKEEYVQRIIEQDVEILSCIEGEKNQIIRELQDIKRNKKGITGYKHKIFDNRLDEEA